MTDAAHESDMTEDRGPRRWSDGGGPALTVLEMVREHDKDIESAQGVAQRAPRGAGLVSGLLSMVALVALVANAIQRVAP